MEADLGEGLAFSLEVSGDNEVKMKRFGGLGRVGRRRTNVAIASF